VGAGVGGAGEIEAPPPAAQPLGLTPRRPAVAAPTLRPPPPSPTRPVADARPTRSPPRPQLWRQPHVLRRRPRGAARHRRGGHPGPLQGRRHAPAGAVSVCLRSLFKWAGAGPACACCSSCCRRCPVLTPAARGRCSCPVSHPAPAPPDQAARAAGQALHHRRRPRARADGGAGAGKGPRHQGGGIGWARDRPPGWWGYGVVETSGRWVPEAGGGWERGLGARAAAQLNALSLCPAPPPPPGARHRRGRRGV
jgi:hypothetical protein